MKKHRTMLRLVYWPGALLFCLVALALPLYAQNNKATIVGTVTDPSSALVVGAKVTATNLATNETSAPVTTDSDGTYTIPNLVPGNYRVTVDQTGFKTYVHDPVIVETNARVQIDMQLTLGPLGGETVTVTTEGPVVATDARMRGD